MMIRVKTARELEARLSGKTILLDRYGKVRKDSNLLKDMERVRVLVLTEDAADVREAVLFAWEHRLHQVVLHTACLPERDLEGEVFISTCRMTEVHVDPNMWTAWIQAGCTWGRVIEMAELKGMAPLFPCVAESPAVDHLLGERLHDLEAAYGIISDNVKVFEVVTEEGELETVSRMDNSELFFSLCHGEVGSRIVTAMEIRLYPFRAADRRYLLYPSASAKALLEAYTRQSGQPEGGMEASLVLANFPALPVIPLFLQGHSAVLVRLSEADTMEEGGGDFWKGFPDMMLEVPGAMAFLEEDLVCSDPRKPLSRLSRDIYLESMPESVRERIVSAVFGSERSVTLMFTLVLAEADPESGKKKGFHVHLTGLLLKKGDQALHAVHTARLHYDLRNHAVWNAQGDDVEKPKERRRPDVRRMTIDLERRKMDVRTHDGPESIFPHPLAFSPIREEIPRLSR